MTVERTKRGFTWLVAGACVSLLVGCGGSSSVAFPPGSSPVIGGMVSMPNGEVAAAPSALARLARAVVAPVEALVAGNVEPVGDGVAVRLIQIGENDIVNGEIQNGTVVSMAVTNSAGLYAVHLPLDSSVDTCRFYLEVGSSADRTLTRAFVYAADPGRVDVDFQSEATVRLLLDQIRVGATSLCALTPAGIKLVSEAVAASDAQVFGDTAAAVNSSATVAAATDPGVQTAIAIAIGAFTPAATATNTARPAATATATATVAPPTATSSLPTPTRTKPTRTPTHVPTRTVPPTRTSTPAGSTEAMLEPPIATTTPAPTTAVPTPTQTPGATPGQLARAAHPLE